MAEVEPEHSNGGGRLNKKFYECELERLQEELVKLQYWVQQRNLKVLITFEGRGSAGRGASSSASAKGPAPGSRTVALPKPTSRALGHRRGRSCRGNRARSPSRNRRDAYRWPEIRRA